MAGVTNADRKSRYLDCKEIDENTILRNSAIGGFLRCMERYILRWRVADSIPIRKAMADGQEKNLIILTQPADFRKSIRKEYTRDSSDRKETSLMVDLFETVIIYNETLVHCERRRRTAAVIWRPDYPLAALRRTSGKLREITATATSSARPISRGSARSLNKPRSRRHRTLW